MTDEPIPEEPNILDRTAVGKLIGNGVTGETVKQYQKASKPEGRYARDPFPEPDGVFNGAPYWLASKSDKIREWDARRQRPGVGGRPRS
jgi:hypothetical protein